MVFVATLNTYFIGQVFGSLVIIGILLIISKAILFKFLNGWVTLYASYLLSMTFATAFAAYGLADGYSPQWKASFFSYLPGHLIWLLYDLLKPNLFVDSKSPKVFSREAMKRLAVFWLCFWYMVSD